MDFEIIGDITDIDTIVGTGICDRTRLQKQYGRGKWRLKGITQVRLPDDYDTFS